MAGNCLYPEYFDSLAVESIKCAQFAFTNILLSLRELGATYSIDTLYSYFIYLTYEHKGTIPSANAASSPEKSNIKSL